MIKVLVTGYGGFLGAEVSRQLLEAGFQVRGIARGDYPSLRQLGVETIKADITNTAAARQAIQGCQAVVHTAALAGVWGNWSTYHQVNTVATQQLLAAAQDEKVRAFVFTSSPSVSFAGEPQEGVDEDVPYPQKWLCHYPHTKALAEQEVLRASRGKDFLTCSLRPHLIWGAGDPHLFPRVIERARQGRLRRVGDGKNLIDVVHVSSAAKSHVQALQKLLDQDAQVAGEAFFITDGQPVECWKWITRILESADVAIPSKTMSFATAYRLGAALEVTYKCARIKQEPPMTRFVASQLALAHYFSIEKARNLLGYNPAIDFDAEFQRCATNSNVQSKRSASLRNSSVLPSR